ncbi:MAG: molybdopterin-guanine dinucleotide biosynthesis protein MobB [Desulfovibrionaceae bacterium]|jgi:molybdopterin-guanine dinucleotide biosynthesis protein B
MKGVQILGYKKSGKTTLCVDLLAALSRRGLSLAALKCTHNPGLDKEDTDTDRFLPYCRAVGALAGGESAMFWNGTRKITEMVSLLDADVCILEGGREHAIAPRVLVLREPGEAAGLSDPGLVLAVYGAVTAPGLPHVNTIEDLANLVLEKGFVLPGLDCGSCGHGDCGTLGAAILAGRATVADCKALTPAMTVTVDGRELVLNPFVERILVSGIRGLLSELKGFGPGSLSIRISS